MKEIKTISVTCDTDNKLDRLNIAELTEFQGGLKTLSDVDCDKVKLSLIKYGFSFPFFVWRNNGKNYLIDGHQRMNTLCKMQKDGYIIPDLPVVYIDAKDEKEAKQKLLRLNSQYGKMTKESVLEFADDLEINFEEIALPDTVIDFTDGAEETEETSGDDEAPEVNEEQEPISKYGEIYELGNSLLMCGDSTKAEDVERLMNGEKADLVFTDPPYGISVVQGNSVGGSKPATFGTVGGGKVCKVHTYEKIIGDETTETAKKSFDIYKDISENQIIFGGNYFTDFLRPSKCWLVWDKQNTGNFADCELAWTSFDKGAKLYHWLWNGMSRKGNRTEEGKTRVHPTQKPVGMIKEILKDFSEENEIILDVFGGSGSTLIACEELNRKCRMIEMSPAYCDVIRRRYTKWCLMNNKPLTSGCLE